MSNIVETIEEELRDESSIIFRKLVQAVRKKWWLLLFGSVVGLIAAFLVVRYTAPIFSVGSLVMIGETNTEFSPTDFLFDNKVVQRSKDLANESIILTSFPLVKKTVYETSQMVSYYRSTSALNRVIEIESRDSPFTLCLEDKDSLIYNLSKALPFRVFFRKNDTGYKLYSETANFEITGRFNEVLEIGGFQFKIKPNVNVLERISEDDLYMFSISSLESITRSYQSRLMVDLMNKESSIFKISLKTKLPDKESVFIDALVRNFQSNNLDAKNLGAFNTVEFIDKELNGIRDSLNHLEKRLKIFKQASRVNSLNSDSKQVFEKLIDSERKLALSKIQLKYISKTLEYFETNNKDLLLIPSSFGIQDPSIVSITNELIQLESKQAALKGLEKSEIRNGLIQKRDELRKLLHGLIISIREGVEIEHDFNRNEVEALELFLKEIPSAEIDLLNIERYYKISESLYTLLLEKKAEAEITKSANIPDIRIVEPARLLSLQPVEPRKNIIYSIFLLIGFGSPIALLFFKVYFDNSLRSKDDVTSRLSTPFLGLIGSNEQGLSNEEFVTKSKSRLAETLRTVRTNIRFVIGNEKSKVIIITSCFPGEGKTFVSTKLALSYSMTGKKVVLIGADMRKPRLEEEFNYKSKLKAGLSNYLSLDCDLDDVLNSYSENLDIIFSGPIPPNPMELLESEKFSKLLDRLRSLYDLIIIDTSPFMLVSDTRAIIEKSDLNLLVLRSGYSKVENLVHIKELTDSQPDSTFATLLNDHKLSDELSYGYYQYGSNVNAYYE